MTRISFEPLPQEAYFAITDERERKLQVIGDIIGHWLIWVTKEHEAEGLPVTADTHVMFGYENAAPHWPSVSQLTYWLEALRGGTDASVGRNPKGQDRADGLGRNDEHAVGEAETPEHSSSHHPRDPE